VFVCECMCARVSIWIENEIENVFRATTTRVWRLFITTMAFDERQSPSHPIGLEEIICSYFVRKSSCGEIKFLARRRYYRRYSNQFKPLRRSQCIRFGEDCQILIIRIMRIFEDGVNRRQAFRIIYLKICQLFSAYHKQNEIMHA